jgi:MraZ protein
MAAPNGLQLRTDLNTQWQSAVERGADMNRELAGVGASSIFEVAFEPSGRFVLPPMLRKFGRLTGDRAFFFGVVSHFMLWDPDVFKASAPPSFAQVGEELDYWLEEFARRGK